MGATIKDIARKLNISVSTVSYALNGGPRSVPEHVRARVVEVARELNYRPNRLARSMVTGRTNAFGVVPSGTGTNSFLSPYIIQALNGVANAATARAQDILLVTGFSADEPGDLVDHLLGGRVDGAVFLAPGFEPTVIEYLQKAGLPVVVIAGPSMEGVPTFYADNPTGVRRALRYLHDLGHRRIAHIAGRAGMADASVRQLGYEGFLEEFGLERRDAYIRSGNFVIQGGYDAMRRFLDLPERPTAVFCSNDEMAIGALQACHEAGVRVPEEMSIIGFDASPSGLFVQPTLTSVRQPIAEMAEAAVDALMRLIEGESLSGPTVFPTELIVRASTSRPQEDS